MADAIHKVLQDIVDAGQLAGVATVVWRNGQASFRCAGVRDLESGAPATADTLYRIASMSKPVTSVAALRLMEEGKFDLDEPLAKRWAPEFAEMRVLRDPNGALDDTAPAERPITFRHLLTHMAGFTYGGFGSAPIFKAYTSALGPDIDSTVEPDAFIAGLAKLPLIAQPGETFNYGRSTDLLGMLIARMEGVTLAQALQKRIFGPLGMADTGFVVPEAKRGRRATPSGFDADGKLVRLAGVPAAQALEERPADMAYASGGAGLWSTVQDYLAFARLFVEEGASGGVRILEPETVALMRTNQLSPEQRQTSRMLGMPAFARGHGFGLGVAVVMEPEQAQVTRCGGGLGSVGWPGAYGGWWQADPNDGCVMIVMTHNMLELEQLMSGVGLGLYMTIAEFQALASAA